MFRFDNLNASQKGDAVEVDHASIFSDGPILLPLEFLVTEQRESTKYNFSAMLIGIFR